MMDARRAGTKPVEILTALKTEDPEFWKMQLEEKSEAILASIARPIMALTRPPDDDKTELIGKRYLCRGGAMILAGPTGIGKSSFSMQLAMCLATKRECFGLKSSKALRVLLVQAENDDGDLAEMRDGVLKGLEMGSHELLDRFMVITDDSSTREKFAMMLNGVLTDGKYDLVIVDPALAYMGCDASNQGDVSTFLRNMLNPVLHKHDVGLILVHHTNKPKNGEEKAEWKGSDLSYIGAGSAEFANWARAVLGIRSKGSNTVFELVASKRGRRLGWKDKNGQAITSRFIAYHREEGVICWRDATEEEIAEEAGGSPTQEIDMVIELIRSGLYTRAALSKSIESRRGCKQSSAYSFIKKAVESGRVRVVGEGNKERLRVAMDPETPAPAPVEEKKSPPF